MSDYPILTGETIDGVKLGEWLEDYEDKSRYATEPEESVWICNKCESVVNDRYCDCDCDCDCDEDDYYDY